MHRTLVHSSSLRSIGYDPATHTLEVEFLASGVYHYHGVPQSVYDGLLSASSHGSYFDTHVKRAGYAYTKVG